MANCTHQKTVRSALLRCPNTTVTLRLLVNVVRVTNLEAVKIEFRHLTFHILLSSSSDSLAPQAKTNLECSLNLQIKPQQINIKNTKTVK